eukprot:6955146-Alexandrium_andersonii.AAC.1
MAAAHENNWFTVTGATSAIAYQKDSTPGDPWGDLVFGRVEARLARSIRSALRREGLLPTVK